MHDENWGKVYVERTACFLMVMEALKNSERAQQIR